MTNLLNSSSDPGSLFKRDEVTASAISVCFAPVLRPWNVKRTLFGDTFETLLKNVPQIEELRNIPCKCLCDANKKLGNGHADLTIDANYSDHSYSDALVVWQKCARHMYHHYLCQLLEICKVVDRGGGGAGGGRVCRVDNELHVGVTRDILYLSLFIIAEEDHDCYLSTVSTVSNRPYGVVKRDRGKDPCADGELCRLNCTNVKYVYECCLGHADGAAVGGGGRGGSSRRGGGRGRKKEASSIVAGNGSGSSSGNGNGRSRSHSSLVIVRDIISDCLYPADTANTAVLCAAYGCYKEALEACRQHLLMHPPQQQRQQRQPQQQQQYGQEVWHCSTADSEEEVKTVTDAMQTRGGGSDSREGHMCKERNGASIDGVPSVRSVLLRCLQIAVSRMVTHTLSVRPKQSLTDPNTFSSSFQPSLSLPVGSSARAVSTDADEKRRIGLGVDIADDVILAVKLLWVLLAREVRTTGTEVDPEEEDEEEKMADGAVKIMIETIVVCMMSSPVCLCASALESIEALDQTGITHTIQHDDHLRNCLQTAWTIGPIRGVCEDPQIKTWTLDLLSHTLATEPDLSFKCYSMDSLRGTIAMSLSKCVLAALGPHLTSHFVRALPAPFFDRLDLDFIAELVVDWI